MNTAKKHKDIINENKNEPVLLPGLPNHLAHLCLSTSPPSLLNNVCTSWRHLIYSPDFPPFFSLYALLAPKKSIQDQDQCTSHSIGFFCFDPIAWKWSPLPDPPITDPPLCMITQHPSFISRILPIQSVTSLGHLVIVSANTHNFLPSLARPLIFYPLTRTWTFGPQLSTPRRWCVTGSMDGSIYVASGTGPQYHIDVARSVERWDLETGWKWEKRAGLKDGRFSREAIEAVGYRGKLCMVNVKGKGVKEGAVFDVVSDEWEEMGKGMVGGWNGPAGVDDGGVMYVVDQERGSLSKYNGDDDCWEELIEHSEYLKGAEQICAGRGRVCVCGGGKIVVVDVLVKPPSFWTLDPPHGMEAVAVHILPRMVVQ